MTPARTTKSGLSINQIARAAGVMMLSYILTGALGIVRQAAIGSQFGLGNELDAYNAANRVSETLFTLISGGALSSAFIPIFSRFLNRDDQRGAWQLARVVATFIALIGLILTVLAIIFAAPIVSTLLSPHADTAQQALTVRLMRPMLGTVVIFGLSGLSMSILNAHHRFLAAALAPSLYNGGLIFGALFLAPLWGVDGLALGTLLGAMLHLGVQLPSLWRLPGARELLRPALAVRSEGVSDVLRLMLPRVLGLGVVQINFWVNAALASGMNAGSLTALTASFALLFTVLGVLGQSVGTAVFPTLAALNARSETETFRKVLSSALRGVLFMAIPATIGLIVLATPLVATIYQRGAWTAASTEATAWALRWYTLGLVGFALQEVLARAFYALNDTLTPVIIGITGVILNIALSLALIHIIQGKDSVQGPFGGLALANALATLVESAALWLLVRRRIGSSGDQMIWRAALRTLLAALGMGLAVYGILRLLADSLPFITLGMGVLVGALVFELLALLLGLEEASTVPNALLRRIRR